MTSAEFIRKYQGVFAPNEFQNITEATFQQFAVDIAGTFTSGDGALGDETGRLRLFTGTADTPQACVRDCFYLVDGRRIVRAKQDFNGSVAPTGNTAYWQVVLEVPTVVQVLDAPGTSMVATMSQRIITEMLAAVAYEPIVAGQYGQHPDLPTRRSFEAYVLGQQRPVVTAPVAPTNVQVNDAGDTMSVEVVPGYDTYAQYQAFFPGSNGRVPLTSDIAYQTGNRIYLKFTGAAAEGEVGIGVASSGSRPEGAFAKNDKPFTGTTVATPPASTLPTVTGFNPASAAVGTSVTISGTGFTGATGVLFNGTASNFTVLNATTINVTVPLGATTGRISVATPGGTGQSPADFTVSTATTTPTATKATAPYFGAIDDVTNTVSLGSAYSFTEVRWGLEGQGPQALSSNSICSPGNIVGRLFAYVIADAATNRLQSDTVYSATFTLAATANNTPSVTLSVMGGVSNITPGQSVTLLAEGQDADGLSDIDFIEYLDNGVKLAGGQTAGNSGSLQTIGLAAGTHNFTLKITDKHGASSFSNVCIVTAAATAQLTELVAFGDSRTAPASRAGFAGNWYEQALADPLLSDARFVGKNNWARGGGYSVYHANDPNASYISFQINEAVGSYRTDVTDRLAAVLIGINDVQGGDSIEDIKAHFTTAIAQVKQSGASRIISATLVTSNYIMFNDAKLADIWNKVQLFNTWLRNNYASIGIDILVDVATDKYMGGPSPGTNDTYFQSDQIHYTPAGAARTTAIFLKGIQLFLQGRSGIVVSDELYTAPLPGTSTGSLSDITPFNVLAGGAYTAQGVATGPGSDAFGKTGLNTQTPRPAGQEVRLGFQYTSAANFTASLGLVGNSSLAGHANYLAGFYLQTGGKIIYTLNGVDFDSGLTVPLNYYICLHIKLNGKVSIEQSSDNQNWTERVSDFATIAGQAFASFDVFGSTASITVRSSNLGVYSEVPPVVQPAGDLNIVFYDDFNRPDGNVDNGWVHPEFFTLVNATAVSVDSYPSGHPPMERPISEAGNRQRATGTYLFNNTGRTPGLVVRSNGAGNYYMLYVTDFGTSYGMSIFRVINYTQVLGLGTIRSSPVLSPGSPYRISFVAYDDQLVGTVLGTNGQPLGEGLRVTNTSFVSGVCGLTSAEVGNTFLDFTLSTV
jgi:hypothetical protein